MLIDRALAHVQSRCRLGEALGRGGYCFERERKMREKLARHGKLPGERSIGRVLRAEQKRPGTTLRGMLVECYKKAPDGTRVGRRRKYYWTLPREEVRRLARQQKREEKKAARLAKRESEKQARARARAELLEGRREAAAAAARAKEHQRERRLGHLAIVAAKLAAEPRAPLARSPNVALMPPIAPAASVVQRDLKPEKPAPTSEFPGPPQSAPSKPPERKDPG